MIASVRARRPTHPALLVFAAAFLVYALLALTSNNVWINDTYYMEVFQNTVLRDLAAGDRWLQMPASAFIPDQIFYFIFRLFMPMNAAFFATAMSKLLLFSVCIVYFCRHVFDLDTKYAWSLALLCSIVFLVYYKSDQVALFRIEYNHFAPVLATLLVVPAMLVPGKDRSAWAPLAFFVIGFACGISSAASLIMVSAAALGALYAGGGATPLPAPLQPDALKRFIARPPVTAFLAVEVGLVLGHLLYSQFVNPHYLGERNLHFPFSISSMARDQAVAADHPGLAFIPGLLARIDTALRAVPLLIEAVDRFPANGFLVASAILLAIAALRLRDEPRLRAVAVFLSVAAIVLLAGVVLAGGVLDRKFYRYYYGLATVALLLLVVGSRHRRVPDALVIAFLAVIAIYTEELNFVVDRARQFGAAFETLGADGSLARCIDEVVSERDRPGRVGVGVLDYRVANTTQIRVGDADVDIVALKSGLAPHMWMQNLPTRDSEYAGFLLAMRDGERYEMPFRPAKRHQCPDQEWSLLGFDAQTPALTRYIGALSDHLWSRFDLPSGSRLWLGGALTGSGDPPGSARQYRESAAPEPVEGPIGRGPLSVRRITGPGLAVSGPRIPLSRGEYLAELQYSMIASGSGREPVRMAAGCVVETGDFVELGVTELPRGRAVTATTRFRADPGLKCRHGYEIRSRIGPGETMWLHHLSIIPD